MKHWNKVLLAILLLTTQLVWANSGPVNIGGLTVTPQNSSSDVPNSMAAGQTGTYHYQITNPHGAMYQYKITNTSATATAEYVAGTCIADGNVHNLPAGNNCTFSVNVTAPAGTTPATNYNVMTLATNTARSGISWGVTYATQVAVNVTLSVTGDLVQDAQGTPLGGAVTITNQSSPQTYSSSTMTASANQPFPNSSTPVIQGTYNISAPKSVSVSGTTYYLQPISSVVISPNSTTIILEYDKTAQPIYATVTVTGALFTQHPGASLGGAVTITNQSTQQSYSSNTVTASANQPFPNSSTPVNAGTYNVNAPNTVVANATTYYLQPVAPVTISATSSNIVLDYETAPPTPVNVTLTVNGDLYDQAPGTSVGNVTIINENTQQTYTGSVTASANQPFPNETTPVDSGYYTITAPASVTVGSTVYNLQPPAPVDITPTSTSITLTYDILPSIANAIRFHLTFPYTSTQTTTEDIALDGSNYGQLMVFSNLIAGVLYGHMIKEAYPDLYFNPEYINGSLFGQLLQENSDVHHYNQNPGNINIEPQYSQLLSPGQGGPYQINNYAIRLPDDTGVGMINYAAMQNGLGYLIAQQNANFPSVAQNLLEGPASLENIYFGPLAAAYFQFNDVVSIFTVNAPTWGPQHDTWPLCYNNLKSTTAPNPPTFFDMIQNAGYNAGLYSSIFTQYLAICSNLNTYATQAANINNYGLNDAEYNTEVGVDSSGTFILYPRQIRFYLDELYNNASNLSQWIVVNNSNAPASQITTSGLETIFVNQMTTLGYGATVGNYQLITAQQAQAAFQSAVTSTGAPGSFNIANASSLTAFFALINQALTNLETDLSFQFDATTESDLASGASLTAGPTVTGNNVSWTINYSKSGANLSGGVLLAGGGQTLIPATCNGPATNFTCNVNTTVTPGASYAVINLNNSTPVLMNIQTFSKSGK